VHSQLSSRENFEHVSRPFNDLCVSAISQNVSWGQLVTDPGWWDAPPCFRSHLSRCVTAMHRYASLPVMASAHFSFSGTSGPTQDISHRLELQQYEEQLEVLLETNLNDFREKVRALP
jgi:hypothetical protein